MKRQGIRRPIGIISRKRGQRRRALAWSLSIAAHVLVFAALFWPRPVNPPAEERAIPVNLVQELRPEQPPGPSGPPGAIVQAALLKPALPALRLTMPNLPTPQLHAAAKAPVQIREAENAPFADDFSDVLSEADVAGAARADGTGSGLGGGGGGGGSCDLARTIQQALRSDPVVRAAVEGANRMGKAIMVWNGDWVRSGGQDGKGLSAVREAILWEVAFAPAVCRNQPVHGLVLLSLADGNTRFAVGSGDWRWSDLLGVR